MSPKVYLVGAGPGKADLISVRGANILKEADVVIYDYLVGKDILGYAQRAELICCGKLGKKRCSGAFSTAQVKINNLLVEKAKEGKRVVRLKSGDPSLFGRLSQELEALIENNIEFEIIPGITAATGAAALSGVPLTDRKYASSCLFVAGREDPKKKKSLIDWESAAKSGTIVLYMAVESLSVIAGKLIAAGKNKNTPVIVARQVSWLNQKILTGSLANIAGRIKEHKINAPAIVIIGEVAGFQKLFNWMSKNENVLFTGLSDERYFLKGNYFHLPLVKIIPADSYRNLDKNIEGIKAFDWLIFTSRYGVEYFFQRLEKKGFDARILAGRKIAVIGTSTGNRLKAYGLNPDLLPGEESSAGLVKAFEKINLKEKKILMPRSNLSDKGLEKALSSMGAAVTAPVAYKNVMPETLPELDMRRFDRIIFTSPSTARNFKKKYGLPSKKVKIESIGRVTGREVERVFGVRE